MPAYPRSHRVNIMESEPELRGERLGNGTFITDLDELERAMDPQRKLLLACFLDWKYVVAAISKERTLSLVTERERRLAQGPSPATGRC